MKLEKGVRDIDTKYLTYILTIAGKQNMTKAAEELFVSQSSLSQYLATLIPRFKADYPDVTIEISELNVPALTRLILEENIDCGIMALNTTTPFQTKQVTIRQEEEVLFAIPIDHPYHQKNSGNTITISDLTENFSNANILLSKKGSTLRVVTDQIIESVHIMLSTICETNSIIATRSMAAMGIGVAFIAQSCASDTERIAYYHITPRQHRLNVFVRLKNWAMNRPEKQLEADVLNYFKQ